ncbi:MAG: Fic family protein [Coriobacteriia bacterium]|nr:Fic family protein [Coriobacteriia bacterium]
MASNRAGRYVMSLDGYKAYVPEALPPNPPIVLSDELVTLLSSADRKLGRLDGVTQVLPNPDLFVAMFVNKEALISSQIEGTQASLVDVLGAAKEKQASNNDAFEVVNYIEAMNYALKRLGSFPLSLRLIKEVHSILLRSGRGSNLEAGEFRASQNWIGSPGSTLANADFVPPTVDDMMPALYSLEEYLHKENGLPPLVKIALIHAQFETIHPFLDGNGRMGRLLITFWLCQQNVISKPLLYLSHYFKQNREAYYQRLTDIRFDGAWEEWVAFFLKGVITVSEEAVVTAKRILDLKESGQQVLSSSIRNNGNHLRLYESLFQDPLITRSEVISMLDVTAPTATRIINSMVDLGILTDLNPERRRNKQYLFDDYLNILTDGIESD